MTELDVYIDEIMADILELRKALEWLIYKETGEMPKPVPQRAIKVSPSIDLMD